MASTQLSNSTRSTEHNRNANRHFHCIVWTVTETQGRGNGIIWQATATFRNRNNAFEVTFRPVPPPSPLDQLSVKLGARSGQLSPEQTTYVASLSQQALHYVTHYNCLSVRKQKAQKAPSLLLSESNDKNKLHIVDECSFVSPSDIYRSLTRIRKWKHMQNPWKHMYNQPIPIVPITRTITKTTNM